MPHHYTLLQLNQLVKMTVENNLTAQYWVEAEISECRESYGHCYLELVEKDPLMNTPVAKASAKCWRTAWSRIKPRFQQTTGTLPQPGMKLLLRVKAQFHEAYGFSWIVSDIDPTYTLGDMARRRKEIIRQLEQEGVINLNRELPLSPFAQSIAVISSATAAGYGDFQRQLLDNAYQLHFSTTLYPATMQGEAVEESIIQALNSIYQEQDQYDAVVIIRGGGATSDLTGFDSLPLAENIANFPLPVITGIGHDRDQTVADIVAHTSVKTPTAAAQLLVENLLSTLQHIADIAQRIRQTVTQRLDAEKQRVEKIAKLLPMQMMMTTTTHSSRLDHMEQRMQNALKRTIERQQHKLELLANRTEALNPELMLKRGYSITTLNGRTIRTNGQLKKGDIIETRFADGTVTSRVE